MSKGLVNIFTLSASMILVLCSCIIVGSINAQTDTSDPKQLLRDFKSGKDAIQKEIQINFDQLINEIKLRLDFNLVDSYLSQASQYFIDGNVSEGINELEKANNALKNSTLSIMNAGDEFVSIANDNSTLITDDTREILDHFGKVLKELGSKVHNSMVQLDY